MPQSAARAGSAGVSNMNAAAEASTDGADLAYTHDQRVTCAAQPAGDNYGAGVQHGGGQTYKLAGAETLKTGSEGQQRYAGDACKRAEHGDAPRRAAGYYRRHKRHYDDGGVLQERGCGRARVAQRRGLAGQNGKEHRPDYCPAEENRPPGGAYAAAEQRKQYEPRRGKAQ